MTLRDHEVLELLKDEPELLALSDAVAATQRAPSSARRVVPRMTLVAGVAAAIVLVVLLWPGGERPGILDRALAAIGHGRVFHLVTQTNTGTVFYDLRTGRRAVETFKFELWSDESSKQTHVIVREGGQLVGDILLPDDATRSGGTIGKVDPAFAALWSGYRNALESGQAKLERKGAIYGHRVFWLGFASVRPGIPGTEVAIDRKTYKPVVFRSHTSALRYSDSRVLVAETTAFRASDFKRRGASLLAGRGSSGGASESDTDVRSRLRAPWLTAGSRLVGLPLTTVHAVTAFTDGPPRRNLSGFRLVYGPTDRFGLAGPRTLSIQELSGPDDPSLWRHIPRGALSIQQGENGDSGGSHLSWTGYAVVRGIYVTIETGRSAAAVLEAARTLHPA
jgi:hypothetical protein